MFRRVLFSRSSSKVVFSRGMSSTNSKVPPTVSNDDPEPLKPRNLTKHHDAGDASHSHAGSTTSLSHHHPTMAPTEPKEPKETSPPSAESTVTTTADSKEEVQSESGQPITRSLFISPDHEKIATSNPTMFVMPEDGEGVKEVPIPESVKETGIVPEGYCVDFSMDPDTVVATLANQGITNTSQLEPGQLERMIAILNDPENLKICPKSVYDGKRALTLSALEKQPSKGSKRKNRK